MTVDVEAVDDYFVWRDFVDEYPWVSISIEVLGGPFFFPRKNYTEALEGAMDFGGAIQK